MTSFFVLASPVLPAELANCQLLAVRFFIIIVKAPKSSSIFVGRPTQISCEGDAVFDASMPCSTQPVWSGPTADEA